MVSGNIQFTVLEVKKCVLRLSITGKLQGWHMLNPAWVFRRQGGTVLPHASAAFKYTISQRFAIFWKSLVQLFCFFIPMFLHDLSAQILPGHFKPPPSFLNEQFFHQFS